MAYFRSNRDGALELAVAEYRSGGIGRRSFLK